MMFIQLLKCKILHQIADKKADALNMTALQMDISLLP